MSQVESSYQWKVILVNFLNEELDYQIMALTKFQA